MCLLGLVLVLALVPFTRFHLKLVMTNSTTIESMDTSSNDHSRYDLGTVERNCQQVCGRNPALYFLPCDVRGTTPVGDGVNWGEHYMRLLEEGGAGIGGGTRAAQAGYSRQQGYAGGGRRGGTPVAAAPWGNGGGRGTQRSATESTRHGRNGARQENGSLEMAPSRGSDRV